MQSYDTLVEALNDLRLRGYTHNFNLREDHLLCPELNLKLEPASFDIEEIYRFEGMSNPDDSSVVYAIESNDGVKGVLVDAYGAYSDPVTDEMVAKLHRARQSQP